jgi:hypothetical protein
VILKSKLIKAGVLVLALFCFIAALSLVKAGIGAKAASAAPEESIEVVNNGEVPAQDGFENTDNAEVTGSPATDDQAGLPDINEPADTNDTASAGEQTGITESEVPHGEGGVETGDNIIEEPMLPTTEVDESPKLTGNELYHSHTAEFCREVLEPMGFTLSSDEYFGDGQNCILLRFSGGEKAAFEAKRLAAVKLGEFVYTVFEEKTGYKTDYLKVHLKLPEGESFALPRENYHKWISSGANPDELFNGYMPNMIEGAPAKIELPQSAVSSVNAEDSPVFKASELQGFLNQKIENRMAFTVEGEEIADSRIYIYIDKPGAEMRQTELEELAVRLCSEVFRNYYGQTNQRVDAFKLIDSDNDTIFVIYRDELDKLWPEGGSDEGLREYIRSGQM